MYSTFQGVGEQADAPPPREIGHQNTERKEAESSGGGWGGEIETEKDAERAKQSERNGAREAPPCLSSLGK